MKPEEFFETLSDIDENMVAKAKPFVEEETVEPVIITPQKRSFKAFYPVAACLGVVALGAAVMLIVNMNRGVDVPYSTGDNTSALTSAEEIKDTPNADYTTYGSYPDNANFVYTGDFSNLEMSYPICIEYPKYYDRYRDLADDSLIIVAGTFVDDTRQTDTEDIDIHNFGYASFNTLKVTQVIQGDISEGDEIVIGDSYVVYDGSLVASNFLTPMIKGDSWVYFLQKTDMDTYYTVGGYQGRYPVPGNENKEFPYVENDNGVVNEAMNEKIYSDLEKMIDKLLNSVDHSTDTDNQENYSQNYVDLYTGDYSEITEFNRPKNLLDKHYGSYEELAADCDLIVKGRFVDDPHQDVDPNPAPDIPLGTNIFSQCKFKVEQIIMDHLKEKVGTELLIGDTLIIQQSTGVYGDKLVSTSQLTPMVKGDEWIYFLKKYGSEVIFYAANDSDGRYLPPDCTTNFDFSVLGYDNNLGYSHAEYFNEEIYNGLLQAMNGETAPVTNPEGNPNTDPPESTDTVFKVFDVIADKNDYSTDRIDFKMEEFPGVTFARCVDINAGHYVEAVMEDGSVYTFWDGWPVESIYLCDLNGDGKREICSTVCMGSGLVDSRVYACDFENKQCYELSDRGNYDFCLKHMDNKLMVSKFNYKSVGVDEVSCDELSLSAMTCHDGTVHHEEGHTHNTVHHEEEHAAVTSHHEEEHPVVTTHHYEDHNLGHQ